MAKKSAPAMSPAAAEYLVNRAKLTVQKNAKITHGAVKDAASRIPPVEVLLGKLYKLSATHERIEALGHKNTAKALASFITETEADLDLAIKAKAADDAEVAAFRKDIDRASIERLGLDRETLKDYIDGK